MPNLDRNVAPPVSVIKSANPPSFAMRLHETGYVYGLYGALDGLSLSYSMVKYAFDLLYTNSNLSSSDVMHDWMMTPLGIAAVASESVTLICCSLIANVVNKKQEKNELKRFIADSWPYWREVMKGLKNTYKGVRGTFQVVEALGLSNLYYLSLPTGIVLGVLSAGNRYWLKQFRDQRKGMKTANGDLLEKITSAIVRGAPPDATTRAQYYRDIKSQSVHKERLAFVGAIYAGVVDSFYLHVGLMTMAALSSPWLLVAAALTAVFFLTCVATRLYEEYEWQRQLLVTQMKVKLALCGVELDEIANQLDPIFAGEKVLSDDEYIELKARLERGLAEFKAKHQFLRAQLTRSYFSAGLVGLQNGLAAYGFMTSLLLTAVMVTAMLSMPFPPLILVACAMGGLCCLLGFLSHSLFTNYHALQQQKQKEVVTSLKPLSDWAELFKQNRAAIQSLHPEVIKQTIYDHMVVDETPQPFIQEWIEVLRSLFSGVSKGQKSVDYALNPLQLPDTQGHYQDTKLMLGIGVISSFICGISFALRAYVRGFSRREMDAMAAAAIVKPGPKALEKPDFLVLVTEPERSASAPLMTQGFFSSPKRLCISRSDGDLLKRYDGDTERLNDLLPEQDEESVCSQSPGS